MRFFARFLSAAALLLAFGCGGGDGESSNDGPAVDCRTEGYGCTGDFSCQLNANDAYECLPSNQGGAAGDGSNARDGGAGDGDGDGNSAGDAGDGGNANDGGAAGSSGNEGGAGGNEAGSVGDGGEENSQSEFCYGVRPIEVRAGNPMPGAIAAAFEVSTCLNQPAPNLVESDFALFEDDLPIDAFEASRTILDRKASAFITIVLDNSPSVEAANAVDLVADAALAYVTAALTGTEQIYVSVASFSRQFTVLAAHSNDLDTLTGAIEAYRADGSGSNTTNLYGSFVDALTASTAAQSEHRSRNREGLVTFGEVLFLTDGNDNAGVIDLAAAQAALDTTTDEVLVVGLGDVEADAVDALSTEDGVLAAATDIRTVFEERVSRILARQNSIYVLGYCSPKLQGDHAVTLAIDGAPRVSLLNFNADGWLEYDGSECSRTAFINGCGQATCGGLWCGECGSPHRTGECSEDLSCSCTDDHFAPNLCSMCANAWQGENCDICPPSHIGEACDTCAMLDTFVLLDASGSFQSGSEPFRHSSAAILDFASEMGDLGRIGLQFFPTEADCEVSDQPIVPLISSAASSNSRRDQLSRALQTHSAAGGTPTGAALERLGSTLAGSSHIFVITDGEPSCGRGCEDLRTVAGALAASGVRVSFIHVAGYESQCLASAAEAGQGDFYNVQGQDEIADALIRSSLQNPDCQICENFWSGVTCDNCPPQYGGQNCDQFSFVQVSGGEQHTCGLLGDGTVKCWGTDRQNRSTPPTGQFKTISAGLSHTCGIRNDGSVICWGPVVTAGTPLFEGGVTAIAVFGSLVCGRETNGLWSCLHGPDFPAEGLDLVSLGGAHLGPGRMGEHGCGLRADGTVSCWGTDTYGQSSPPAGIFVDLAAGGFHTCGIREDTTIACWGSNYDGQTVSPAGSFQGLTAGVDHTCGIRVDGSVTCWGANRYSQSSPPQPR